MLVIDLLGPSLEDLFDMCSRKLTIRTVAMVAKQMVHVHLFLLFLFIVLLDFSCTKCP